MIRRPSIWRKGIWTWLLPLSLMIVGGAALTLYVSAFSGRVRLGSALLQSRSNDLEQLRRHRIDVQESLDRIEDNRRIVKEFYESRLSTEKSRLTAVIAEVKDLARRAGLEPGSISYPVQAEAEFGLSTRYMVFSVDASYAQLRRLINFLELSDMFLVLNEITLGGHGKDENLSVSLRLSTTFKNAQTDEDQVGLTQVQG